MSTFTLANGKVHHRRLSFFLSTLISEFEGRLDSHFLEATGKQATVAGSLGSSGAEFLCELGDVSSAVVPLKTVLKTAGDTLRRRKAQFISGVSQPYRDSNFREILVEAGLALFRAYEWQFMNVKFSGGWKVAVAIMSQDIVDRVVDEVMAAVENKSPQVEIELSPEFIVKAVISRKGRLDLGKVINKLRDREWTLGDIFDKVGLVTREEGDRINYFQKDGCSVMKFGLRRLFSWEKKEYGRDPQAFLKTRGLSLVATYGPEEDAVDDSDVSTHFFGYKIGDKEFEELVEKFKLRYVTKSGGGTLKQNGKEIRQYPIKTNTLRLYPSLSQF